jgi:hypothetical protein
MSRLEGREFMVERNDTGAWELTCDGVLLALLPYRQGRVWKDAKGLAHQCRGQVWLRKTFGGFEYADYREGRVA